MKDGLFWYLVRRVMVFKIYSGVPGLARMLSELRLRNIGCGGANSSPSPQNIRNAEEVAALLDITPQKVIQSA